MSTWNAFVLSVILPNTFHFLQKKASLSHSNSCWWISAFHVPVRTNSGVMFWDRNCLLVQLLFSFSWSPQRKWAEFCSCCQYWLFICQQPIQNKNHSRIPSFWGKCYSLCPPKLWFLWESVSLRNKAHTAITRFFSVKYYNMVNRSRKYSLWLLILHCLHK